MISKQPTEVVNAPEGVEVHASGVDKLTLGDESVGQRLHNNVVNFIEGDATNSEHAEGLNQLIMSSFGKDIVIKLAGDREGLVKLLSMFVDRVVETVGVDEAIHIMQAALTIGVVHSAADRINSALGGNEE